MSERSGHPLGRVAPRELEQYLGTLPFLGASTTGGLLMAFGHLIFLANLGGLVFQFYRARAVSAWREATAETNMAEARL